MSDDSQRRAIRWPDWHPGVCADRRLDVPLTVWATFTANVRARLHDWLMAPRYDDPWFTLSKLGVFPKMEPHDFKPATPIVIAPNGKLSQRCVCGHTITAMSQASLNWSIYEHIKFSSSLFAERAALAEAARRAQ